MTHFTPPDFVLVQRPSFLAAGWKISLTKEDAPQKCPELWQSAFTPKVIDALKENNVLQGSYGISILKDPAAGIFDYWAAIELPIGIAPP